MRPGTLMLIPTNLAEPIVADAILPRTTLARIAALDHFIAENAKTARAFLKAIGFAKPLREVHIAELNEHTRADAVADLLRPLLSGHDVGLMSEAGAPGVADPGAAVVALAHQHLVPVQPLIGPSALLLGLMASGLNGQRFAFHGYLPQEKTARVDAILALERESRSRNMTQLFIETPYRNQALLDDLVKTLAASTRLVLAANLTAADERIVSRTVQQWRAQPIEAGRAPALFLLLA